MKQPSSIGQRRQVAGLCLALAAITFAVFGQTLRHQFVDFDDSDIYDNPGVARGLTLRGIVWAFAYFHSDNWYPLTWLSHMLDCQLYGLNPGGHHLTNVLLHTATVILLFLVLRQMTGTLWRSAFVAAVFAIHPLRVESVAWVTERKDMLNGLFFILTIGAYVRYTRRPGWHGSYGLILLFFALGLMCKPMLVTLPLVLLLLDYWPLQRKESAGKLVLEKLPLLVLSAASCVVTVLAQHGAIHSGESYALPLRIANALTTCMVYLRQMVWPAGLAVFYPYPHNGLPVWEVALAGMLLAGFSAVAVWQRRTRPWLLVGWLWYLVMLLPVVGIIQVGEQAHADRYTYLPQIGIYIAVTWWVAQWRVSRAALGVFMAGVLAVLMVCAWKQTAYWQNSETLWTRALACTTDNAVAHLNFGNALHEQGKMDEAIAQYQEALRIKPDSSEARNNIGNVLNQMGKVDEAIPQYLEALRLNPGNAQAHYNLGNAFMEKGKVDEAIPHYQIALQLEPAFADAHHNLGKALFQKGKVDEAIAQYRVALQINALQNHPGFAPAHYNLGIALLQKGSVTEAIFHFQEALRLKPDYAEARVNLGDALLQTGKVDDAITQYREALRSNPGGANVHNNFGSALYQRGRADEAIAEFQKALEIMPDNASFHFNLAEALLQKGREGEAITQYQLALQIEPADPATQNNLAWLLATGQQAALRNGDKAVQLAQQANALTGGKNLIILHTLAAAFAEAGRFGDAVQTAQKAVELARAAGRQDLAGRFNDELKRYEAGLPVHQ